MTSALLSTKFYISMARPNAVLRPRLAEKLLGGVNRPASFALLSGPAGFGKTTILGEFVNQLHRPVAWLSLDEGDNDPVRFWTYLIVACQSVQPGIGESVLPLLHSPQPLPDDTISTILINEFVGLDSTLVLILDDFHVIQNKAIHAAFSFLLDHLPDRLYIVLSTRVDPPWPLARMRARNQLIELRAADLRFNTEEATAFLNQTMGLNLSAEQVADLEARTEGWIAALQLVALSMQDRSDVSAFIKAFTGSHVYVAEYLIEEVLQRQPENVQAFLLQTSVLESLNAGLCEAVTGRQDGHTMLASLQRLNLFVIPLDDEGKWYRYHHLFADLLQARLRQALPSEEIADLHRRAAAWYERNGYVIEAVNHRLAVKDFEEAARLIEIDSYSLVTLGELSTLNSWIDALPDEVTHRRPQFLLAKAWALLFTGDSAQIDKLLRQIDALTNFDSESPTSAALLGGATAIRAFFALMSGDHVRALELAEHAEKLLPSGSLEMDQLNPYNLVAHSVLPYTIGMAYRGQGQFEKAVEAFESETQMFTAPRDILGWTIATIEIAVIRRMQGRLHESTEICQYALHRIEEQGVYSSGSVARVEATLSEVLREQNNLDEAYRRVTEAIERMQTWNMPTDRLAVYLTLGRVQLAKGDLSGAYDTVRLAKDLRATHQVFVDLSRTLEMLEIRAALADRDLTTAARLVEGFQPGTSHIVYLREQELVLLAQLRLAQGKPDETVDILSPLIGEARQSGRLYIWLAAQVQLALALEAKGDRKAALVLLMQALVFAETEGFVRVFVDEGEAMRALLAECRLELAKRREEHLHNFVNRLLEAFDSEPTSRDLLPIAGQKSQINKLIEPLSPREIEVLQLIAAGDSNKIISDKLVITVSAVKKHTSNIFGKLNVNSRTQAVARARQLGLLSADS